MSFLRLTRAIPRGWGTAFDKDQSHFVGSSCARVKLADIFPTGVTLPSRGILGKRRTRRLFSYFFPFHLCTLHREILPELGFALYISIDLSFVSSIIFIYGRLNLRIILMIVVDWILFWFESVEEFKSDRNLGILKRYRLQVIYIYSAIKIQLRGFLIEFPKTWSVYTLFPRFVMYAFCTPASLLLSLFPSLSLFLLQILARVPLIRRPILAAFSEP